MFYPSRDFLSRPLPADEPSARSARARQEPRAERPEAARILRVLACGGVDDGETPLLTRVLDDLGLPDARKRSGAESERGGAADIAWRYFSTSKQKFILADCSGREHSMRGLVAGASHCDAALVLADARKGLQAQTRRQLSVLAMMRVRSVLVAVDGMDLVDWDRARFEPIRAEALECASRLGMAGTIVVPVGAADGGNLVGRSRRAYWYSGQTLLQALEALPARSSHGLSFRLVVQWLIRPDGEFSGIAGEVMGAPLRVGDTVRVLPSKAHAQVRRISTFDGDLEYARPGQPVAVMLDRELEVARGDWLVKATDVAPAVTDRLEANVVWLSESPLVPGRRCDLRVGCTTVPASVRRLDYRVDTSALRKHEAARLDRDDVGRCEIVLERPVPVDSFADSVQTGGLIFIDPATLRAEGAGMVTGVGARVVVWHESTVDHKARAAMKGHPPQVIWLTGLSGAGKSTIANALESQLNAGGVHTMLLDGDNIRHGLCRDLGFSAADRAENIRRLGEVVRLMLDAGLVVITAFISPFRSERQGVRERMRENEFLEVFLDTPLAICETRDPKGLYKLARAGKIPEFTGVSQPYEPPLDPEARIDTSSSTVTESVQTILTALNARGFRV